MGSSERKRAAAIAAATVVVALLVEAKTGPRPPSRALPAARIGQSFANDTATPVDTASAATVTTGMPPVSATATTARATSSATVAGPVTHTAGGHTTQASSATTTTTSAGSADTTNYTGAIVPTEYGNVQVAVAISNGRMTDVEPTMLPRDAARSRQINDDAAPKLRANALACQCWNIDTVSGASVTSDAYRQSLQSALAQAGRT